jgi:hypothetical protein
VYLCLRERVVAACDRIESIRCHFQFCENHELLLGDFGFSDFFVAKVSFCKMIVSAEKKEDMLHIQPWSSSSRRSVVQRNPSTQRHKEKANKSTVMLFSMIRMLYWIIYRVVIDANDDRVFVQLCSGVSVLCNSIVFLY